MTTALDEIMDSLEQRLNRRERRMLAAEEPIVRLRRVGADVPPVLRESYSDAWTRYDEARLAYNAALGTVERYRPNSRGVR